MASDTEYWEIRIKDHKKQMLIRENADNNYASSGRMASDFRKLSTLNKKLKESKENKKDE